MSIATHDRRYPQFTIGDRLRKARTLLGPEMDVARFAELLGVGKNTVTNYELERTSPERMKPLVLRQWAIATGVDVDWLRTGVLPEAPDGPNGEGLPAAGDRTSNGGVPVTRWLRHRSEADLRVAAA